MSLVIAKENMVTQQLRTNNILNESILDLYHQVPREKFTLSAYASMAYADIRLPLPHLQTMLTPLEEATILQALDLQGNENVLEIGTGSGFLTALLAKKAKHVLSIDCYEDFTEQATHSLKEQGIENVTLKTGDGSRGWMQDGPYDVIVFTGGINELGDYLRPQLMRGGQLFAIVGKPPAMQGSLYQLTQSDKWEKTVLFDTDIDLLNGIKAEQGFNF